MFEISLENVCFVAVKARAFDVKEGVVEEEPGSNPADDGFRAVLEAYADDPSFDELKTFIDDLSEDQQADLVALVWIGRGDYAASEFDEAKTEARDRHTGSTSEYLLGIPLLSDHLANGLDAFGMSCADFEV